MPSTSFVETTDHSQEQDVDMGTNKSIQSDTKDDGHEVVSYAVEDNVSSLHAEAEPGNGMTSVNVHEREEQSSQSQIEPNLGEGFVESSTSNDRSLEQFSEVLLDSDSTLSDHEAGADDITDNKKDAKRVRFADEVGTNGTDEGGMTGMLL